MIRRLVTLLFVAGLLGWATAALGHPASVEDWAGPVFLFFLAVLAVLGIYDTVIKREKLENAVAAANRSIREQAYQEFATITRSKRKRLEAHKDNTRPWYVVLGVEQNATDNIVLSAYVQLHVKYSGYMNAGLDEYFYVIAELKSREIKNAYDTYKQHREAAAWLVGTGLTTQELRNIEAAMVPPSTRVNPQGS